MSTYYYKAKPDEGKDDKTIEEIIEIIEILPESGYRPVTNILKRSRVINHKKVYRIMRANDLLCRKNKRFKAETTDSRHKYKEIFEHCKGCCNNRNQSGYNG